MNVRHDVGLVGERDLHLFNEGTHHRLWRVLGAHPETLDDGTEGTFFGVWAPNAEAVSVVGDFNDWDAGRHSLRALRESGVWEGFVPGVGPGAVYKYRIRSSTGESLLKADPLAFAAEEPPETASVVWDLDYEWSDTAWMERRAGRNDRRAPLAIYEVHLGSWRRGPDGGWLGYREAGEKLARYVTDLGFTHVELLPVMEHPYYGSWGYQCTGFFAPTARYGRPQDLMALVDELHRAGVGVILDWIPSHFPVDEHALARFDGTHLYEHADPRRGFHPDWGSLIFNYGRHEVRSFLASSADFWLEHYHADGLRLDAVASMLYLDYSRRPGEWLPNPLGGHENLEAVEFLRQLNTALYERHPGTQTFAEESTAWPRVSHPVDAGGLGFGFKWDLGWMNDMLEYMRVDPARRKHHHDRLTFRSVYATAENYLLPLSHDEVVHGKGSLLRKMPGDEGQRFAGLRLLLGYQYAQPGKVLLFMGGEIGEPREWDHESALDWTLVEIEGHAGLQHWVRDLNALLRERPALYRLDSEPAGFEWIEADDAEHSVVSFLRRADDGTPVLVVANFTPVTRPGYRVGVPVAGRWKELLNSDAEVYGGSGVGNLGGVDADAEPRHGHDHSVALTLPPLAVLFLTPEDAPIDAAGPAGADR